jgi:tetratricopeptide (TPR) repeat protein
MPLREATTSSLEALKAYGLGLEHWSTDDAAASIPLFEHAIELDPEFAAAYVALGRAYQRTGNTRLQEAFRKAYALRNRTSERERLDITATFYQFATMQVDQTISSCLLWKQTYPRDFVPHRILGFEYAEVGRWEDSVEEFGAANRIDAGQYLPYAGLLYGYMALGRLSDAHSVYEQAHSRKLGGPDLEHFRYWLAFLDRDNGTMENFASTLSERPEFQTVVADTEAYFGRMDKARELWRRAAAVVLNRGDQAAAAGYQATAALCEALFENSTAARQNADVALGLIVADRTNPEPQIALALALAGNSQHARTLAEKVRTERPLDTALNDLWLAEIRSVLRLREGQAVAAVDELAPAATFERGWESPALLPAYLRAQAWLTARRGEEAAKEFKKILDHPGIVLNAPIGALAHLGLGRAYRLEADAAQGEQCASLRAKARAAYEEFLTLWKDADPDIPILRKAKAEYRKL